jgi:RNase P/RNase MRP subunit p29
LRRLKLKIEEQITEFHIPKNLRLLEFEQTNGEKLMSLVLPLNANLIRLEIRTPMFSKLNLPMKPPRGLIPTILL